MISLIKQRLLWRFVALGVLTLCLSILSHSNVNTPLASTRAVMPLPVQTQRPTVRTQTQAGAPLVISSPRIVSWDGQNAEVAIDLVNVSSKPIRAYAIKQALEGEETHSGQVMFTGLDLTNSSALKPNQLTTNFDVYQISSDKEEHVIFFVDYVEFSDGTKWGLDSANFAERSAGQRAAAYILTKRLLKILNTGNPVDVVTAIERGATNVEPPSGRSSEWKEGFRMGCKSLEQHLKRAQVKGGLNQIDRELREFGQRFKGAN